MRCAVCGSTRVTVETKNEGYNIKKGLLGKALIGDAGFLLGAKGDKINYYHCVDCGHTLNKPMGEIDERMVERCLKLQKTMPDYGREYQEKYPNAGWIFHQKTEVRETATERAERKLEEQTRLDILAERKGKKFMDLKGGSWVDVKLKILEFINNSYDCSVDEIVENICEPKIRIQAYVIQLAQYGLIGFNTNDDDYHNRYSITSLGEDTIKIIHEENIDKNDDKPVTLLIDIDRNISRIIYYTIKNDDINKNEKTKIKVDFVLAVPDIDILVLLINNGKLYETDIEEKLNLTHQATTMHLKRLSDNGLVLINDDNKIILDEVFKNQYSITELGIKELIENEPDIEDTNESHNNNLDNYDALKKLKELLDIGAITQEEYDKKKKELLNL